MLIPFLQCCARMPLAGLHFFGAGLGWLVYGLSPTYRRRCRENLRLSGLWTDEAAGRRLLHAAVAETGKSITELCKVWFGRDDEIAQLVVCDDWGIVETAQRAGTGVIFLTPHLGCFEISALYGAQRLPLTVLYRPPKPSGTRKHYAGRSRARPHHAGPLQRSKECGLLYKALQRGEAIGVLPDQAPGVGEGEWANFFGRPRVHHDTGDTIAAKQRRCSGHGFC